jgi:hypothetical protein
MNPKTKRNIFIGAGALVLLWLSNMAKAGVNSWTNLKLNIPGLVIGGENQGAKIKYFKVSNWFDCGKKETLLESNAILLKKFGGNTSEENWGTISLIRIDGTNKVEVYSQSLHSQKVFSVPSGDKIIILTTFKSGDKTDLYTVGIR